MRPAIELSNVLKIFPNFVLKDITFSVPRGYITGLIGPNGSGKTTIIKLIMNLLNLDGGSIKVFGLDSTKRDEKIKNRIGFVYDTPHFYDDLSLATNKNAVKQFYSDWDDELFEYYTDSFGLKLHHRFRTLSQGMKMKFALSLALSHNAELIIMDEPTSGLDPVFRREFLEILHNIIQDEHRAVLFSTHITSDLDRIADYISFVDNGELVFSQSKDELFENWAVVKTERSFLNESTRGYFHGVKLGSFHMEGLTSDVNNLRAHFGDYLVYERPSIEDIMYFITKGNGYD